jgi:hypothetical protein
MGSLHITPLILPHLSSKRLRNELPVFEGIIESERQLFADPLLSRRYVCVALAHAVAQVKDEIASQSQERSREESGGENIPTVRPTWLPSEEQFPATLFAWKICGEEVDERRVKRARRECIRLDGSSPWDSPRRGSIPQDAKTRDNDSKDDHDTRWTQISSHPPTRSSGHRHYSTAR